MNRELKIEKQTQKEYGIGEAIAVIIASAVGYTGSVTGIATAINVALAVASVAYSLQQAKAATHAANMESLQRNGFRNFRQPLTPRRIVMGRVRVAGPLIFIHNLPSRFLAHLIVALSGYPIQQVESVWLLQTVLPYISDPSSEHYGQVTNKYASTVAVWPFLGSTPNEIGDHLRSNLDPRPGMFLGDDISPDIISATDNFNGIAALHVCTFAFGTLWEGQSPDFAAIVKGLNTVYDPRSNTTGYTVNPALLTAWYLQEIMDFPASSIDQASLIKAANICDELVDLKSGSQERRYEVNGVISADSEHRDVITQLQDSMAGAVRYASGLWFIEAGAPKPVSGDTVLAYDESQLLAPYDVDFEAPDRSLPNAVRGNFVDRESWQAASYPSYEDTAAAAAENGTNWLDLNLPLTTSHTMAQRIARIRLGQARARRRLSISLDLRGLLSRPGDVVTFNAAEIGMNTAVFEVSGFTFARTNTSKGPVLGTRLDLVDYNPGVFTWNEDTDELPLMRGSVNVDSIQAKYLNDPVYLEVLPGTTAPSFSRNYNFSWGNPDSGTVMLKEVDIILTVRVKSNDGVGPESSQDVTRTESITNGDETKTLNVTATYPAGYSFTSATVITATVQAKFDNNTTSPLTTAVPV
ncbi:MAG: phage tail fiber protein [Akkermansiaceae bacterium]|nr:phage tail fiber protein [Akkermansiaceae bacterium]